MSHKFVFLLSDEEKQFLRDLVKESIASKLRGEDIEAPEPESRKLHEPHGAFVTLNKNGQLRGCIGNIQGSGAVYKTIWEMARSAAFSDPRFPELTQEEFDSIEFEVSVLSPLEPCRDVNAIEVGRHGLVIQRGPHSGLFLPQVPVEWGWDREEYLRQTCRKAGLAEDVWYKAGTNIYWFQAEVF